MNPQDGPLHHEHGGPPLTGPPVRGPQANSQPLSQGGYPRGWLTSPYPQLPAVPPRRNYAKAVALVALTLLAVSVLTVGVLVVIAVGHRVSNSPTNDGSDAIEAVAVSAVCQPGSYAHTRQEDAPTFQRATGTAGCTAKLSAFPAAPVPAERYGPLWIVQFPSPDIARSALAADHLMGATALSTNDSGKAVLVLAPADWTGISLEPLTQFGFVITPPS